MEIDDATNSKGSNDFQRISKIVINLVYRDVSRFGQYPTISGCIALGRSWRKIVASRPPVPVIAAKTNNRGSLPPIRSDSIRSDRSIDRIHT